MEFGRSPFRALGTFSTKWEYACAALVHEYNDDICKELIFIAKKYIPGLKKVKFDTDIYVVPNKDNDQSYGMTEEEFKNFLTEKENKWDFKIENYWEDRCGNWNFDCPDIGYVDDDILTGFLKKENISLEEFLINKKYVVIQDGDEYNYYGDMKKTGLINMDAIDHEYCESYFGGRRK